MTTTSKKSPFDVSNVRLFIAFRVFFNARFYYPVFTILFLDFGLTIEQFAFLNAIWAMTIVVLEVPSGALADILGRRRLLVIAALLMVAEMALLCLVPLGRPNLLFAVFLLNRVLSGTAEATASGADEAIAYDALKQVGYSHDWGRVLEMQVRFRSAASICASVLGAAVYDPSLMQRCAELLGLPVTFTQDTTLRFPLYLTLIMATMALLTTLSMREVNNLQDKEWHEFEDRRKPITEALKLTLRAGAWIAKNPFALMIIATGLLFDHILRMLLTLNSMYYRLINLPEASFGLIGAARALLGIFITRIALRLVRRHSPRFNLGVMAVLTLVGLFGMTLFLPIIGLIPVFLLSSVMFLLSFFLSHYLNKITSSQQRATVLSFKGLSLNLAYSAIGVLYSIFVKLIRLRLAGTKPDLLGQDLERIAFIHSIAYFPWYFILGLVTLVAFARWQLRHSREHQKSG